MYKVNPISINTNGINHKNLVIIDEFENKVVETYCITGEEEYVGIRLEHLNPCHQYSYSFLNVDDSIYNEQIKRCKIIPERYESKIDIPYVYYASENSKKLFVIFSSAIEANKYNYLNQFKQKDVHQLYLADDNIDGQDTSCAYYLGNGNLQYEQKVYKLIEKVRKENQIDQKDVVLFGSSKGGFASLYYTFKYGYGSAILGSPTVYLGKMHKDNERGKKIIQHIMGDFEASSINQLDKLIINALKDSTHQPHLFYHVGEKEPRYTRHAVHLLKLIDETKKATYELDLGPYSNHNDVVHYFPQYAQKAINCILNS
ncbi:accessory Sec system protein Asp2 [Macrococcus sp. DPC7161]|uniref:accessory Sec system protein Asp2 n=1 Tax=Macrococcus sp. DPC7161 TaxID=2507060 RepID=UPI0013E8FB80|nr:accessory Sec system protein Asp2 [Macrococcus sp. DPC7161]